MKRILIDYKKLDHKTAAVLIDSYPYGYGDDDLIVLKKPSGEIIEAVEVRTDDTIYLVKISKSLSNFIANFEENIEKELDQDSSEELIGQVDDAPIDGINFERDSEMEGEDSY